MFNVVETKEWMCGKYKIIQRPRTDNPSFAVFLIYHHNKYLGRQFSMPNKEDCRFVADFTATGKYHHDPIKEYQKQELRGNALKRNRLKKANPAFLFR